MSIVDAQDRAAAAGLTSATRTFSSSVSPSLAGYALANLWLGTPLVAAGALKLAYDLLIYRSFRRVRSPEEREVKARLMELGTPPGVERVRRGSNHRLRPRRHID